MDDILDFDDDNISLGSENDDIELDELEQEELLAGDPNQLKEKPKETVRVSAGNAFKLDEVRMDTAEDGEITDDNDDEIETFNKRSFKAKSSKDIAMDINPAHAKRVERAKRFGTKTEEIALNRIKVQQLYESLGIETDDPTIRRNALLLHGVDNLSTSQIFTYFNNYPPKKLEWINDSSCVVVYSDSPSAQKSILNMSKSIKQYLSDNENVNNSNEDQDSTVETESVSMDISELPEGRWRLADDHKKQRILIRYANTSDVKKRSDDKERPAVIKGLISKSKKEKFHRDSIKQAEHNAKQDKTKPKRKSNKKKRSAARVTSAVRGRTAVQYEDSDDLFGGTYHEETEPPITNKIKTAALATETTEKTKQQDSSIEAESEESDEDFQADLDDLLQRGITAGNKRPAMKMKADIEEQKISYKRKKIADAISSMDVRSKINKQKGDRNLLAYEEYVQQEEKPDLRRKLHRTNY